MKQVVYDTPYKNDEQAPEVPQLRLLERETVTDRVTISQEDLKTCFSMTPYYYRTSERDRAKLDRVDEMELTVSFVLLHYRLP